MRISIFLFVLLLVSETAFSQCNIKSTEQGEGYTTYYMDPELVAQNEDFGIALSVQSVDDKYYLALTFRFAGTAQPLEEKVAMELVNGYTLEMGMYTMEVGSAQGIELCMAVFFIEDEVIPYFKTSDLKAIRFKTQDTKSHVVKVNANPSALKRQLKCFLK
ncbi:MAG: hypothetical protein RIC15_08750 [Vicingaceae bacterium]